MTDKIQNETNRETYVLDDEIDLTFILDLIVRNKFLIGSVTFVSFIIFLIYSIFKPKIWQGSFQIVLSNQGSQSLGQANQLGLASRFLGSAASSSTKTEVGILESQSVLMPVFEYVNSEYKKSNPTSNDLIFSNWKNNKLNINLKEGTSILNISYKDMDKKSILDVLSMISQEYQKYTGKKKLRSIKLSKKYVEDQISKYQIKASKSIKKAEEFAIDQDLIIPEIYPGTNYSTPNFLNNNFQSNNNLLNSNNLLTTNDFLKNTNIEETRVNAANKLRQIDSQIKKIENLKNDNEKLIYIGSIIPEFKSNSLWQSLERLDNDLINLKTKYLPKHKAIKRLLLQRKNSIDLLQKRSIDYLKAQRLTNKVIEESARRPKGVVTKYKELMREANRDENILVQLENQQRKLLLEEARQDEPWQLITKPSVSNKALGIGKRYYALLGLIAGSIIGLILAYIREYSSGLVYERKKLEKILETETIYEIDLNSKVSINSFKEFIYKYIKLNKLINIRFIYLSLELEVINKIKNELISENNFFLNQDKSLNIEEEDMVIFITTINPEIKKDLISLKNKLRLLGKNIGGILFIN